MPADPRGYRYLNFLQRPAGMIYEQDTSWDLARLLMTLRVCDSYWWFSFNVSAKASRCHTT